MDSILVLIDFTSTSEISLDQAIALAKLNNSNLVLGHIANSHEEIETDEFKLKLQPYISELEANEINYHLYVEPGDFKYMVKAYVNEHHPDLVVVGTHGKTGLKQNLFGSNIYNLTKSLPSSILVVNDYMPITVGGFRKVLLPVGAHPDYLIKVKQLKDLVADAGEVIIFEISKAGVSLDREILNNVDNTKEYLDSKNIKWQYVQLESQSFSMGYSKETLQYADDNDIDLISIMVNAAHQTGTETMDKENILLNTQGIPVICANT